MTTTQEREKLKLSRERRKLSMSSFHKQREREKAALAFQVPDMQWSSDAKQARQGQPASGGLPAIPPRPMMSITQIDQPCQLVKNQIANAHLGINVHPLSEDASKENAETIQGLIRKIEQDSNAPQARLWAAERASKAGWGVYRVNARPVDNRDRPVPRTQDGKLDIAQLKPEDFDQVLTVERIVRQECVHFDPAANNPDFSDGNWAFIETWMPYEDFKRDFPRTKLKGMGDEQIAATYKDETGAEAPDWTKQEVDGHRAVCVVEYFYKERDSISVVALRNGKVVLKSDLAPGIKHDVVAERDFETVNVLWCKHNGVEILEEGDWDSPYIPLIPVVGKELIPFDGERRWDGIIGPAMDGQRFFNVAASTMVERMLLEPKSPFVADPRQIANFQAFWNQANTRAFSVLPYDAVSDNGTLLPPPGRVQIDTSGTSLAMMGMQEAKSFVQTTTGIHDPALGEYKQQQKQGQLSGRAILALQGQSDATNNHYLQNLASISMPYEALVLLSKIPKVYDRPGRVARLLDMEDNPKEVMLNAPFVTDQDGRPQRVESMAGQDGMQAHDNVQTIDLTKGVYSVTVTIGKSFQSRLQHGQEFLSNLYGVAQPDVQLLMLPLMLKFADSPGAQQLFKLVERYRNQKFPGIEAEEGQKKSAEQLEAENQALQAKAQEMEQMLQRALQEIQTDQAKQQATILKAAKDNETKEKLEAAKLAAQSEREREKNDTAIILQEMKNTLELMKLQIAGSQAQQQQSGAQRHEFGLAKATAGSAAIEQAATMDHDAEQADRGRDYDAFQADRDRETAASEAEAGREFESEQAEADRLAAEQQAKTPEGAN